MENQKYLIAYFSHSGNTKKVAKALQKEVGGDIFEIKAKTEYPKNYNEVTATAKEEKQKEILRELVDNGNVENYDIIFLGTPVWWYTMATPVKTFLTKNNFEGKTIVPFCTHGGGGASSTYIEMQNLALKANFKEGYTSYNNSASAKEVKDWINKIK